MENIEIKNWAINALIFSLPFSWYMCFQMYKDFKKKDKIIDLYKKALSFNVPSNSHIDKDTASELLKTNDTIKEFPNILCIHKYEYFKYDGDILSHSFDNRDYRKINKDVFVKSRKIEYL